LQGIDAAAGRLGDIIVGINGHTVHRLAELTDELERVGVGGKAELEVEKSGQRRTVAVDVSDIGQVAAQR
jgi:S1-C subfamily serine protease